MYICEFLVFYVDLETSFYLKMEEIKKRENKKICIKNTLDLVSCHIKKYLGVYKEEGALAPSILNRVF